jgi:hypothetical protein
VGIEIDVQGRKGQAGAGVGIIGFFKENTIKHG